jgi:hypothetical protein
MAHHIFKSKNVSYAPHKRKMLNFFSSVIFFSVPFNGKSFLQGVWDSHVSKTPAKTVFLKDEIVKTLACFAFEMNAGGQYSFLLFRN